MQDITRRQFLTTVGSGAVATISLTGTAAADHRSNQPEHVTLRFDQATLERYQPLLELTDDDRSRLIGQYAWTATSPEYDTDCHVYWASYTHQSGVSSYDSHYGDHEPAYVFTDSETGNVVEVAASVYHWLRGRAPAGALTFENETNVVLRVIDPWHQYTAPSPDAAPYRPQLNDLRESFDDWLANGLEESLEPGTVVNPWRMQGASGRGHWWRDTIGGFSYDAVYVSTLRTLGFHEAGAL